MKLIILILINIYFSIYSYEINTTKLSEKAFSKINKSHFMGLFDGYKSTSYDIQVATITIVFNSEEIGEDFDAVTILARNKAKKMGADLVYYISGTEFKNTKSIASSTFRLIRSHESLVDKIFEYQEQKSDTPNRPRGAGLQQII